MGEQCLPAIVVSQLLSADVNVACRVLDKSLQLWASKTSVVCFRNPCFLPLLKKNLVCGLLRKVHTWMISVCKLVSQACTWVAWRPPKHAVYMGSGERHENSLLRLNKASSHATTTQTKYKQSTSPVSCLLPVSGLRKSTMEMPSVCLLFLERL